MRLMVLTLLLLLGGVVMAWTQQPQGIRVESFTVADDLSQARIGLTNASDLTVSLDFSKATTRIAFDGGVIEYYPPEHYAALGQGFGGTILLSTDLPRSVPWSLPIDLDGPATQLKVQAPWPDAPTSIEELYGIFDADNDPAAAILCDDFAPVLTTWADVRTGACYVWCSGYSRILRDFLRSQGVPARLVGLNAEVGTLPNGVLVQSSEGHATVERWDGDQWAWIDPTHRVLSVSREGRTLSLRELIAALTTDPSGLAFTRWSGAWVTAPYAEQDAAFTDALSRYYTADKRLMVAD